MVQFAAKLRANKVAKWEEDYVDYDGLKRLIKRIAKALRREENKIHVTYGSDLDTGDDFAHYTSDDDILLNQKESSANHDTVNGSYTPIQSYGTMENNKEEFDLDIIEEFELRIMAETKRVEEFYQKHLKECIFQIERLSENNKYPRRGRNTSKEITDLDAAQRSRHITVDRITNESIKWACIEVYRTLNYLHSYAILNYTAFVKIIKKHDKATKLKKKKYLMQLVHKYRSGFCDAPELIEQMAVVEKMVAKLFYRGNVVQARSELLVKHMPEASWEMIHTGMRVGMMVVLFLWTFWNAVTQHVLADKDERMPGEVVQAYRGMGVFLLCFWFWTSAVYFWNTARVNYTYLFEFDPRHQYTFKELLNKSSNITIIYLTNILVYFKIMRGEVFGLDRSAANYMPLIMFIISLLIMIFPINETVGIYNTLYRVILAPMYEVTFFTSFAADILTSLVRPLVDYAYTLCFYSSGYWKKYFHPPGRFRDEYGSCQQHFLFSRIFIPLVVSLPLFFRFLQNIRRYYDTRKRYPHLSNATKYALAHSLVLLGAVYPSLQSGGEDNNVLHIVWAFLFIISTIFTYCWDVFIDWGLGERKWKLLREQRMFADNSMYYSAMVLDLFLRFSWCVTLIPQLNVWLGGDYALVLTPILSVLELIRRTFWSLLRVEYEHLYNTQGYRRVDFVPLHFDSLLHNDEEQVDKSRPRLLVIIELLIFVMLVSGISFMALVNSPDD